MAFKRFIIAVIFWLICIPCDAIFVITRTSVGGVKSNVFNIYFGNDQCQQSIAIVADPADLITLKFESGYKEEVLPTSIIAKHVLKHLQSEIVAATISQNHDRLSHLLKMQVEWDDARRSYIQQEVDLKMKALQKLYETGQITTPLTSSSSKVSKEEALRKLYETGHITTPPDVSVPVTTSPAVAPSPSDVTEAEQSTTDPIRIRISNPKNLLYQQCATILLYVDFCLLCLLALILYYDQLRETLNKMYCRSYWYHQRVHPGIPYSRV